MMTEEEVEEGGAESGAVYDEDVPSDSSPWAGSDRDYSYEEVSSFLVLVDRS